MLNFKKNSHHDYDYDLIVIGSGSGGSVGAHYARELGKKVAIFESGAIGGECPNFACVPTKALLHAGEVLRKVKTANQYGVHISNFSVNFHQVKKWKDLVVSRTGASHGSESFEKEGIHVIKERAEFVSPHAVKAGNKHYSAAKFLIATGSKVFIPPINGLAEAGFMTFKEAVDMTHLPQSILIFGAGPVGCELAFIYSTFGSRVILVNRSGKIMGKEEPETADLMKAVFENQGIEVLVDTTIEKVNKHGPRKAVHLKQNDKSMTREVDEILISTGKIPVMDFGAEHAGLALDNKKLVVNKFLQTSVPHIFAAGDLVGPYLFTHTGYYQSAIAAHNAFSNKKVAVDYTSVPRCIFTSPEVASVGMTEEMAIEKGIKIKKGITETGIIGRSNTENEFTGFVKVITDKKGIIIGATVVAPHAGEMIHELALAVKLKVHFEVIGEMMHAYPTYSEAIKIACSNVE